MEAHVAQLPQAIWSLCSSLCHCTFGNAAGWWSGRQRGQGTAAHARVKTMLVGKGLLNVLSLSAFVDLVQLLNL